MAMTTPDTHLFCAAVGTHASLQGRQHVQVCKGLVPCIHLSRYMADEQLSGASCTHLLTQQDQEHTGAQPRWFRVQLYDCLSYVTQTKDLLILSQAQQLKMI